MKKKKGRETKQDNKPEVSKEMSKKEKKRRNEALPLSLSLSLSLYKFFNSLLLTMGTPESPKGDWGMMSRDSKKPWAEEVRTTEEVPLKEPTGT